ncbi:MAG TPA: DHA2 family efflux MFS transporter permease subunit [Povalibacter sp.]|uniref:DHA2 family efflux MFS transporter permease subunit n=1 Tax=Povalibacter sp. TaxID=1962978 RepID=UPI002CA5D465|nr:DHA2 family efflux MFS transporter permease subunit [Povalibacter sp.]HMN46817.1 DHA2 family efflux MFS transporter permease subunit [Povalibacter sp.]
MSTETSRPVVPHHKLITVSLMLATMMQSLDGTIANVALPHIQGSLAGTQEQMSWVLTSYILAVAIMTPLTGWLAGQFGRKKVFLISIVGFTVASVLCGLAQNLSQMVAFRLLQGLAGAALVPLSQAILLDINPPERHARAMSTWVMGVTLGPILGPALGAWLTDQMSWRWVFYINIPIGVLALLGLGSFLTESKTRRSAFDFMGFATLSIAIAALQLMLDRGQLKDWFDATEIWIYAAVALVGFYLFVVHSMTTREPFIDLKMFKDRNFSTGAAFIFLIGVLLFATLVLLPPLLQDLLGYPVMTAGLLTAPRGFGTVLASLVFSRLLRNVDVRWVIAAGFAISAISLGQMCNFYLQMDDSIVAWTSVVQGFGVGLAYIPLATLTFGTLAPRFRNEATSVFNLLRNLGSSVGIAAVQALFIRNTQIMHARLGEHVTPFAGSLGANAHSLTELAAINGEVTRQATMIAYNNDFKLMLVLSLAAIPLVFLFRKPQAARTDMHVVAD